LCAAAAVGIVSSHSAVGEAPETLASYRQDIVSGSVDPRATVDTVEADLGTGPTLDSLAPGQSKTVSLTSGGRTRTAILSIPDSYYPGQPTPVLLAYHGYRQTASDMKKFTRLDGLPAIVVYLQGIDDAWEGAPYASTAEGEDLRFTRDVLAAVNATYHVDRSRIYATGMSNGGGFAAKLVCRAADIFAAVASVSGAYYPGTGGDCSTPATSFLEIHGALDETINYGGGVRYGQTYQGARSRTEAVANRNGCSTEPVSTALAGDVRRVQWPMCRSGRDVVHLRVGDGGHTWPGDSTGTSGGAESAHRAIAASDRAETTSYSLDATNEVWAFVSAHQLAR